MPKQKRIGILTSGGDCPGLNAAIRGVARAAYEAFDAQLIGIIDGYRGLIQGESREMRREEFSGILTLGGTILGTSRQPFKLMKVVGQDSVDKVAQMKRNYKKLDLDCLMILGGNGTHKTANMLSAEGLNVIALPKTIDNDIYGTDVTFGFQTAVDIATEVIDRIHTTASSHGRVMIIELMGNKAGWLTLYAGIAGGADIILLPEIPYDVQKVAEAVAKRERDGKGFSIIAIAEGALSRDETAMDKLKLRNLREQQPLAGAGVRLSMQLQPLVEAEMRVVVPGHIQRGGSPCPYDRVLATKLGAYAVQLMDREQFGNTVAVHGNNLAANPLREVAGIPKPVVPDDPAITTARQIGVCFGD